MRTNRQKKGEQTETQVLGNCLYYWRMRRVRAGFTDPLESLPDNQFEALCENVASAMVGVLSYENWKKAVDMIYFV